MRARATIVAETGPHGTVLARLRGEPPLLLRQTGPQTVHLVGGAAGPLGGDDLRLEIEVAAGARLCIRSAAASVCLPGRGPSRMTVTAEVAAGGALHWLPEQLIAAHRCDHHVVSNLDIAEGGELIWRDELICGRHGEPVGEARLRAVVAYAGKPLLRQTLATGQRMPGWDGPAVLGAARAVGSVLRVNGRALPPAVLAPTAVRSALTGPATLTSAVAPDAHRLRELLKACAA
jgi:urease accessory protein